MVKGVSRAQPRDGAGTIFTKKDDYAAYETVLAEVTAKFPMQPVSDLPSDFPPLLILSPADS
jgi:hypothetical protein